jgi:hypothetical protein
MAKAKRDSFEPPASGWRSTIYDERELVPLAKAITWFNRDRTWFWRRRAELEWHHDGTYFLTGRSLNRLLERTRVEGPGREEDAERGAAEEVGVG